MNVWGFRGGRHGEFEQRFLDEGKICLTWNELQDLPLSHIKSIGEVRDILKEKLPNPTSGRLASHGFQISSFLVHMQIGDLVLMPLKHQGSIAVGKIVSDCQYAPKAPHLFRHFREVKWQADRILRSSLDQQLLYSLNRPTTIFKMHGDDLLERLHLSGKPNPNPVGVLDPTDEDEVPVDLAQTAMDQVAQLIIRKFKGHGFEVLVEAVLKAQGFATFRSPEGADKGVDILAAPGSLGFGTPKICVQVKSTEAQVDDPTVSQLLGTMQRVQATHGLIVSWSGFKQSVNRERRDRFFNIRLWDQEELLRQILENYEKLDPDIRAELPLKRIWTIALPDDED